MGVSSPTGMYHKQNTTQNTYRIRISLTQEVRIKVYNNIQEYNYKLNPDPRLSLYLPTENSQST